MAGRGQAVKIVDVVPGTSRLDLKTDLISKILLSYKCKDKPVAIIAIAGEFRQGKSFLLNFMLRYLQEGENWITNGANRKLEGFEWRGGMRRETTGMVMWSEPFIVRQGDKEIAVLLMDTQGIFDSEHTLEDSAVVFALSTMISSIQIYNLKMQLNENNLQILEYFTYYGKTLLRETNKEPFQTLMFLIRDWIHVSDYPHGADGGKDYLAHFMTINDNQPEPIRRVREHVAKCFESVDSYLMPKPGNAVETSVNFDGQTSMIDPEFLNHLQLLLSQLLGAQSIKVKKINGVEVTGHQLMNYITQYFDTFEDGKLPPLGDLISANARGDCIIAMELAKDYSIRAVNKFVAKTNEWLPYEIITMLVDKMIQDAINVFDKHPKIGDEETWSPYKQQLIVHLQSSKEEMISKLIILMEIRDDKITKLILEAKNHYKSNMDKFLKRSFDDSEWRLLSDKHNQLINEVRKKFVSSQRSLNPELLNRYLGIIKKELCEYDYPRYVKEHEYRKIKDKNEKITNEAKECYFKKVQKYFKNQGIEFLPDSINSNDYTLHFRKLSELANKPKAILNRCEDQDGTDPERELQNYISSIQNCILNMSSDSLQKF